MNMHYTIWENLQITNQHLAVELDRMLFLSGVRGLLWMSERSFLRDQRQPPCRQRGVPVRVSARI